MQLILLFISIGVLAIISGVFYSFLFKTKNIDNSGTEEKQEKYPYVKKQYLMTNREREYFIKLKEEYGDKYYIVPQVPLSRIVDVNRYEKEKYKYRTKIDKKILDYVLFDPVYFTPQLVIELDDSTHLRPDRVERDNFVDKVMQVCGVAIEHKVN